MAIQDIIDLDMLKQGSSERRGESVSETHLQGNSSIMVLEAERLTKRNDFSHEEAKPSRLPGLEWLLASSCRIDKLPKWYAIFAKFVPTILHRLHVSLLIEHCRTTILAPLRGPEARSIHTALSASSAREPTNYQRLEFLGDSILKLATSIMLMARHVRYPESILTRMKEHIVSNAKLARTAISTSLDQFIITEWFTGAKWKPPYKANFTSPPSKGRREISTKILADVVEALIGASFVAGDFQASIACLEVFLPDEPWSIISRAFDIFSDIYEHRSQIKTVVDVAETLVNYTFSQKALVVEALTHSSHQGTGVFAPYERLEFLGDSVLDMMVTNLAYNHEPPLPVKRLHLIRSVLVNADYLAYLCFSYSVTSEQTQPVTSDPRNITTIQHLETIHIWQLLRYASPTIRNALSASLKRLEELKPVISDVLSHGNAHPWTLLARVGLPKPFSDIIESIVGAIYIDSKGSMTQCEQFLDRLGLIGYLNRVMNENIALLHPKEDLGQLSDQDEVRYEMRAKGEGPERKYHCTVVVGTRQIASATGQGRFETETMAAEIACSVLREERMELDVQRDRDCVSDTPNSDSGEEDEGSLLSDG